MAEYKNQEQVEEIFHKMLDGTCFRGTVMQIVVEGGARVQFKYMGDDMWKMTEQISDPGEWVLIDEESQ